MKWRIEVNETVTQATVYIIEAASQKQAEELVRSDEPRWKQRVTIRKKEKSMKFFPQNHFGRINMKFLVNVDETIYRTTTYLIKTKSKEKSSLECC